jgi:WS/DGAT/MGAT family acyltransferase
MERLSGLDASFLYMETPQVPMHVAFTTVLDPTEMPGGYSFQSVADRIADKVRRKAAFRRRLVHVPFELHHPVWIEDPDFDIIHHVRQVALPKPGGVEELGAMVGRIISTPLDRSRPLWEVWVIEGLERGRFALLVKFHHANVDGVSGAALLMHLLETDRDPPPLGPPDPIPFEEVPSDLELVGYALRSRFQQPLEMLKLAGRSVQAVKRIWDRRHDPLLPPGGTPLTAPRTHFNASITARRNLAFTRVPLESIKAIKNVTDATVNDVVLAITGGALRAYLESRGSLPSAPLLAVCPMSVRSHEMKERSNNQVSAMFTNLATHLADPLERLRAIHEVTVGAKEEHNAIGANMLQDWAELAAPTTFGLAVRLYCRLHLASMHRPIHNLVISNVPGPRFPLYFAGAQVEAIYPIGPVLEGAGLNVTVMSYLDSVDFSIIVDSSLMPDVWDLAGYVDQAFRELHRAALGREPGEGHEPKSGPGSDAAPTEPARPEGATPSAKAKRPSTRAPKKKAAAEGARSAKS